MWSWLVQSIHIFWHITWLFLYYYNLCCTSFKSCYRAQSNHGSATCINERYALIKLIKLQQIFQSSNLPNLRNLIWALNTMEKRIQNTTDEDQWFQVTSSIFNQVPIWVRSGKLKKLFKLHYFPIWLTAGTWLKPLRPWNNNNNWQRSMSLMASLTLVNFICHEWEAPCKNWGSSPNFRIYPICLT